MEDRIINKIILHCSATPEGRDVSIDTIRKWHTNPKNKGGRGWSDIGYHFVILLDGTIERGRPIEKPGAHCRGQNANSIGICYVGGTDISFNPKDTRTKAQKHSLQVLIEWFKCEYPDITIHCHNEFSNKACPSFKIDEL